MNQPDELKTDGPLVWSPGTGTEVWQMFSAAIKGEARALEALLQRNPSLARCSYAYRTPLYFAVREERIAAAKLLLDRGSDAIGLGVHDSLVDIARDRGYQSMQTLLETRLETLHNASERGEPVAAAIRAGDIALMRRLLAASPELLHAGDRRSNRPIHWAVMTRQIDVIDLLLTLGADINARRSDGARPIQLTNGDYNFRGRRDVPATGRPTAMDVLTHLRANGANCDICTAASIGDFDRVRELVQKDPAAANRVSEYVTYYIGSGSPLRNAAGCGHIEIVRYLLEHGADPNLAEEGIAPRGHALYSAVYNRHFEIAKLLLEHGAYPSPPVESSADALSIAIRNDDGPMIELLASYGSARGVNILAYYGDVQTAAAVFAANPSLADNLEAFVHAGEEGHPSFVRLMLRYQPDLARRVAVAAKTPELIELLFQHGMNASGPDWLEATPLHHFARKGDDERATIFLDHGALLDARDDDLRSTPLGWAAKFGRMNMVDLLLDRGARPNLPDDPPWATPLAWANRYGQLEIAELLKKRGAH